MNKPKSLSFCIPDFLKDYDYVNNGICFNLEGLLKREPKNYLKKNEPFPKIVSSTELFNWKKASGIDIELLLNCPLLTFGFEHNALEKMNSYYRGEILPDNRFFYVYQWVLVEKLALFLCQFMDKDDNVFWIDENCHYLKNCASYGRKMCVNNRKRLKLKIQYTGTFFVNIIEK